METTKKPAVPTVEEATLWQSAIEECLVEQERVIKNAQVIHQCLQKDLEKIRTWINTQIKENEKQKNT